MESKRRLAADDYSTGAAPWHVDGLKNNTSIIPSGKLRMTESSREEKS